MDSWGEQKGLAGSMELANKNQVQRIGDKVWGRGKEVAHGKGTKYGGLKKIGERERERLSKEQWHFSGKPELCSKTTHAQ
jgi:hypothetical protein